jgi:hypothetical protein
LDFKTADLVGNGAGLGLEGFRHGKKKRSGLKGKTVRLFGWEKI